MPLKLTIENGNDAFQEERLERETAALLVEVAGRIECGEKAGKIRDGNGNECGSFELTFD